MYTNSVGWRGRLGILVIDIDAIAEVEFGTIAPDGMTVHAARFNAPSLDWADIKIQNLAQGMAESPDLARSLDFLGRIGLDAICLCYTTASLFGGAAFDDVFPELAAAAAHGVQVFTSGAAMRAAISESGVREPFMVTPTWFTDSMTEAAERYFTVGDQRAAGSMRFDLGLGWRALSPAEAWAAGAQWEVRPADIYRQVKQTFPAGADGVVIPGNGFGSAKAIALLENDLGVPVITANQACVWQFLEMMRIRVPVSGYGRVFTTPSAHTPI
jgi:maleate isomerase